MYCENLYCRHFQDYCSDDNFHLWPLNLLKIEMIDYQRSNLIGCRFVMFNCPDALGIARP